jgi:hypothetical protein
VIRYDWLVVGGAKAQYKGTGTINGAGNYGFLLTATGGALPGRGRVECASLSDLSDRFGATGRAWSHTRRPNSSDRRWLRRPTLSLLLS